MAKNLRIAALPDAVKRIPAFYRKALLISISVVLLQIWFGFDPKFCIMNLIWLLV